MMKKLIAMVLIAMLLLTGCQTNGGQSAAVDATEPTAVYDWMAGESPVMPQRMGIKRIGTQNTDYTISPNGLYYIYKPTGPTEGFCYNYVLYSDHGSDTVIKLCGRADCNHNNPDCNACIAEGNNIYYHEGYLYVVSGEGGTMEGWEGVDCKLIRMNLDGSDHVTILDLDQFAQDLGYDFAECEMIDSGVCLFGVYEWIAEESGPDSVSYTPNQIGTYRLALGDSKAEPQPIKPGVGYLYHCGDVFLALKAGTQNGGYGEYDFSLWDWDIETNTATYLTDHPGIAGFYGKEYGYYFRDGAVIRLNYETREEERLIETGLDGDYYAICLPDCLIVAEQSFDPTDNQIYIYNWAYELVDTIKLPTFSSIPYDQSLIAETEERLIFSDDLFTRVPKYYIEKSELGTGKAKVYSFKLPDLTAEFEYWEDMEWLNNG